MSVPHTIRLRRSKASEGATYRAQPEVGVLEFLVLGTLPPNDPARLVVSLATLAASLFMVAWDVRFAFVLAFSGIALAYAIRVVLRMARRWTRRVYFVATSDGLHVDAGFLENAIELSAAEASRLRLEEQREERQRGYPLSTWWLITQSELGERIEVVSLYDESSARWALEALRDFYARDEAPPASATPTLVRALGPRPPRISIIEPYEDLDRQCGCSDAWQLSIRWSLTRRVFAFATISVAMLLFGIVGLVLMRNAFLVGLNFLTFGAGLVGTAISLRGLVMGQKGITNLTVSDEGLRWSTVPLRVSPQPAWPGALRVSSVRVLPDPTGEHGQVILTSADQTSHVLEPALQLTHAEADYIARAVEAFLKAETRA